MYSQPYLFTYFLDSVRVGPSDTIRYILGLTGYTISDPMQAQPESIEKRRRLNPYPPFAARLVQRLGGTIYAGSLTKVVHGLTLAAVELPCCWQREHEPKGEGGGGTGLSAGRGNETSVAAAGS